MRCNKYLNKFEIVITFLISFIIIKKGFKRRKQPKEMWRNIIYMERLNNGK